MLVINHIVEFGGFVGHGLVGGIEWRGRLTELVRPKMSISGNFNTRSSPLHA